MAGVYGGIGVSLSGELSFNEDDFDRLNQRIQMLQNDAAISCRAHSVIYLILSNKFYREPWEINEALTDGGNDCGIDAVFIDRRADEPVAHLFQSKVFESKRKAKNPYPHSSLEKVHRFFQILKDRKCDLSKVVNPKLEQKILEIRAAIDRDSQPLSFG